MKIDALQRKRRKFEEIPISIENNKPILMPM
jgi:hypothetical protein